MNKLSKKILKLVTFVFLIFGSYIGFHKFIQSTSSRKIVKRQFLPIPSLPNELFKFRVMLSDELREKNLELLQVFLKQITKFNITYIPSGGTLLGIHRHHGFIPWDDDIDISILSRDKLLVINALSQLNKTHQLLTNDDKDVWKFFKTNSSNIDSSQTYKFRYPFVDILILNDFSGNKFRDVMFKEVSFSKDQTFPLIKRPFDGLQLYSPCNMKYIFQELNIDINQCVSSHLNHIKITRYTNIQSVNCDKLKMFYPFVERSFKRNEKSTTVTEKLKLKNKTIQTARYSIPNKCTDKLSFYPSDLIVS